MHWAREYIGRQWSPDGEGPVRFSCWGLVRHAMREHLGIELDNAPNRALRQAIHVRTPQEGDVCLMRSVILVHCGLLVRAGGRLGVLHSAHDRGVVWQPINEATAGMRYDFWRPAC